MGAGMTVLERDLLAQDADRVGVTIGVLPAAPLSMPKQVLEQPLGLWGRVAALFGAGVRTRGIGH